MHHRRRRRNSRRRGLSPPPASVYHAAEVPAIALWARRGAAASVGRDHVVFYSRAVLRGGGAVLFRRTSVRVFDAAGRLVAVRLMRKRVGGGGDIKAWSAPSTRGVTSVVNLNLALAPAAYARRRPCALAFDPVRIEGLRSQLSWFNTVTFRYCLYTHTDTPPHTPFLTLRELVAAPPRLPKRHSRRLLLPSPVAPSPRVPGRIHVAT